MALKEGAKFKDKGGEKNEQDIIHVGVGFAF
jgi:hypothetical protein